LQPVLFHSSPASNLFNCTTTNTTTISVTMATQRLHGSCACGRNRYVVELPTQQMQQAELRYDNTSASRRC
jgi:hypothetical protein